MIGWEERLRNVFEVRCKTLIQSINIGENFPCHPGQKAVFVHVMQYYGAGKNCNIAHNNDK